MGSLHAQEFASMVDEGEVDLDAALRWHLGSNHFPPLPSSLLEPAKVAIALASADDWDAEVPLPDGVSWRDRDAAPAWVCVKAWHLGAFVES